MATNEKFGHTKALSLVCSDPATPASGDPVICGAIAGVALTDERTAGDTTVALDGVFELSVKGHDGSSNASIGVGAKIYYKSDATPKLNVNTAGVLFGKALEAVTSGSTATIQVLVGDK